MIDACTNKVPSVVNLIDPVFQAIHHLGGSGKVSEVADRVMDQLKLDPEAATWTYKNERTPALTRRLASARTILKSNGYINNSERGVWTLTPLGLANEAIDPKSAQSNYVTSLKKPKIDVGPQDVDDDDEDIATEDSEAWRRALIETLLDVSPSSFERLCQRILRESGFIEVEVTGKSGDGGIDGHGIIRLSGLISFPVMFQCKRYAGNVTPSAVRDLRGAMQGRAEKGLILTTGSFTQAAQKEATRDGAPPIDLIDGESLVDLLKDLRLGVKVTERTVEDIEVVPEFFKSV